MTAQVRAVLQNLVPIVDNGQTAPDATYDDTHVWGATLSANTGAARSGIGVTADGALMYGAGPPPTLRDGTVSTTHYQKDTLYLTNEARPGRVHILIVEDDDGIAEPLAEGLSRDGFAVSRAASGAQALQAPAVDVILLDLGLPDVDGYDLCRQLRARSAVPILVITARGSEADRVIGLELGADDYLVKPFGFRELVARIRAVLRRSAEPALTTPAQVLGALTIDRRSRRVLVAGSEVALSPKEFDLLALLAEDPGAVVTRQTILEEVWDPHWYGPTKTVDVHVASLRRKLGAPEWIQTVRRVGLRLGDTTVPPAAAYGGGGHPAGRGTPGVP
jgi:DNA-binding response OmpR family regulator